MADTTGRPAAVPQQLGPWQILSRVGSGGMGVVYKCTRADLGDKIAALKVIRPGLLDDPAVQARFAREVEVLRRVRDVHISEFIDADLAGEPAWLATAFIEGPNLRDHVAAQGPLPEDRWWELARGLAQSLAVLEVHGITHRDMKPANVILSPHGPVLIDFGIAIPEDAASLTGTGLVTGSPAWLSPEQANLQHITPSSDIFSLGSLLAFAGTGRPPFGAGAHVAVLLAIATRDPDTIGLSDDQRRLLAAMMAKDPADRPTARQVLQWTKRPLPAAQPIAPRESDATSVTQVLAPGNLETTNPEVSPLVAGPTVVVPAVTAPAPAPAPVPVPAAASAPVPAAPPQRKRHRSWLPIMALLFVGAIAAGIWWFSSGSDEGGSGDPAPSASPSASPSVGPTPPPPAADQVAKSGSFVLSPWSIENGSNGEMTVTGNVKNTGTEAASGFATVYIYSDGVAIGSASGQLPEVAPGASVPVTLTGTDKWQPGQKSVSLVVQ